MGKQALVVTADADDRPSTCMTVCTISKACACAHEHFVVVLKRKLQ